MIGVSRPFPRTYSETDPLLTVHVGVNPCSGGAPMVTGPLPVAGVPYAGTDPSNQATWTVRGYRPRPGMIGKLNFNGAAVQDRTPTGGVQRGRQRGRRRR